MFLGCKGSNYFDTDRKKIEYLLLFLKRQLSMNSRWVILKTFSF